jgi:hypothetical protein
MFHGTRRDDVEKHQFICEAIWTMNKVVNEVVKITQLKTTLRNCTLHWYMKYKVDITMG